jgi:pectinesterase
LRHLYWSALVTICCTTCLAETKTIVVAADGSGDFKTVQEAIAAVPNAEPDRTIIHIKPGTYQGQIVEPKTKLNVTFEGEDVDKTILTFAENQRETASPGVLPKFRGTGVVILGDGFHADKITFENTSGNHGQALALRIDGDQAVLTNCKLLGWQDTLMINTGRIYFKDCYIAGRVDFIYGSATAVFDHCEIHSKNGGHVTAASTPQDHPYGFVFLNCNLTGDAIPWVSTTEPTSQPDKLTPKADLGRPWRPYASVTYITCQMGDHIKPEGWNNWGNASNEETARYAEYKCTGPGADRSKRVAWSKELTDDEAAKFTIANILGGEDGWNPQSSPTTAP